MSGSLKSRSYASLGMKAWDSRMHDCLYRTLEEQSRSLTVHKFGCQKQEDWDPMGRYRAGSWAHLLHGFTLYVCVHCCNLSGGLPVCPGREGNRIRILVLSVFMWMLWVSVWDLCGQLRICRYVCTLCVCLLGKHLQPSYCLDPGKWSSSNLTTLRHLDLSWHIFM